MRANLDALAKQFCPDGAVPVAEEREHAAGSDVTGSGALVSVAYHFLVNSIDYLLSFSKILSPEKNPGSLFSDFKKGCSALQLDGNLAAYLPFLALPVSSKGEKNGVLYPVYLPAEARPLFACYDFFGRIVREGEGGDGNIVSVEYAKTRFNGTVGRISVTLVGIYKKKQQQSSVQEIDESPLPP